MRIFKGMIARRLTLSFIGLALLAVVTVAGSALVVMSMSNSLANVAERTRIASASADIRADALHLTGLIWRQTFPFEAKAADRAQLETDIAQQQQNLEGMIEGLLNATINDPDEFERVKDIRAKLFNFNQQVNRVMATAKSEGAPGPATYHARSVLIHEYELPLINAIRDFEQFEFQRAQEARRQVDQAIFVALGVLGLIAVLAVVAAFLMVGQASRRLIAPLTLLHEGVEQLQSGQLDRPVQVTSRDELGALAAAFNTMAAQLQHRIQDSLAARQALEKLNAELEERVAQRTADLQASQQELQAYSQSLALTNQQLQKILAQSDRRAALLEASAQVARAAAMMRDPDILLPQVMDLISERFGYYHAGVFLLDETGEWAILRAANSEGGKEMMARGHRLRVGVQGLVGWVTQTGQPRVAVDTGHDAVHFDNPFLPQTRSELALPLKVGERILGALDVQSAQENAFGNEDVAVLQSLADQLTVIIETARLFQQTQTALDEAQKVYQRYTMQEWAGYLTTGKIQSREYAASPALLVGDADLPELDLAIEQGQVFAADDLGAVLAETPDAQRAEPLPARAALVAPIKVHDQIIGVLDMREVERPRQWTEDEVALLDAVATQVGLAVENARLFEQTQVRVQQLAVLNEISRAASGLLESEQLIIAIYEQIRRVMRADAFYVALYDPETQTLTYPVCYDEGQRYQEAPSKLRPGTNLYQVITTGEPVFFQYNRREREQIELSASESIGSTKTSAALIFTPMKIGDRTLGVLSVQSYEFDVYTQEHLNLLAGVANQVAVAIENTRLFEQTQARVQQLAVLNEISRVSSGLMESAQLLTVIYEQIQRVIQANAFFVGRYEPAANAITYLICYDEGRRYDEPPSALTPGSLISKVIHSGEPELLLRTPEEVEQKVIVSSRTVGDASRVSASLMYAPLKIGDRVTGVISAQSYAFGAYTPEHLNLLAGIANQVSVALENARLFEQTRQQVQDLANINRIGQIITSALNSEQLYDLLHEQINAVCPNQEFYVATYAQERNEILFPAYYVKGEFQEVAPLPADQGITGYAIGLGRPLLIRTREELDALGVPYRGQPCRSYLAVPIRAGERLSGVMAVQDYERDNAFDERHMALLSAIAPLAATAMENVRLLEEARHRALQLSTAVETGKAATALLDMNELLRNVVELVRIRFGYDHTSVFLLDETGEYAVLRESTGDVGRQLKASGHKLAVGGESLIGQVTSQRKSRIVTDREANAALKSEFLPGTRTALGIPLVRGERVIGALDVQHTEPGAFSLDDVTVLELLADQIAIAIENARLFQEAQRRARLLQAGAELGQAITSILDPVELQNKVVTLLLTQFDQYYVGLFLLDSKRQYAVLQAAAGAGSAESGARQLLEREHRLEVGGHSMVGWVCINRQPRIALDVGADAVRFANPYLPDTHSELALPLIVGDELLGALDMQSTQAAAYSEEDIRALQSLANQIAIALRNAMLVTEVRKLFEEQKETAEKLREMDKLKSQFLANMSHELRTPLNSIIGFSRVILKGIDGPLTDMQKQDLTAIHGSGTHLLSLINDILDISKIEAGKMELSFEEVELQPIIKGVLSTAIGLTKDKAVNLVQKVPDDLPTAWADPVRSRQVLLNLVSNAAKFTEKGSITIEAVADARFIRLSVRDTGIGIPQEKLDKIFEAFTQADASTTRKYGGTGLGLAIARSFVEMHGGEMWVESEVGVGTTFYFTLPRAKPVELPPSQESPLDVTTGKKIILAIDDDQGVITLYRRYLEQQGYRVVGVSNSQMAIEQARRFKPHAITLDILMPEKDGWAVLQELKQDPETRDIPVVVCSIISEQGKGFSLGAADYLVKPIMQDDLVATLKRLDGRTRTNVLVIDDRPEDILLIRRILEAHPQYVVSEAHSGAEGLASIQRSRPDLIVLDLMMPEMDGFAVLETLKSDPTMRDIPIVVVTAKDLAEEDLKRLNGFIQSLLAKGRFTEKELLDDIAIALARITGERPRKTLDSSGNEAH